MKHVAIIVAHPYDETLWAGGTIISNPHWNYFIVCLCRADDKDRSQRFYDALNIFRAEGAMGNLDDGPEQKHPDKKVVEDLIMQLLPAKQYDLVITHSPAGEHSRHRWHEVISTAVIKLWQAGKIKTKKLWAFAHEDGNKDYFPQPQKKATIYKALTKPLWQKKHNIIIDTYGFSQNSRESQATSKNETFWQFTDATRATEWLNKFISHNQ
ncbi:MAG: PIG-L family deacetylase [Bacteroidales bacterium]|nr:PIG-L family deacetylase [Bacteroidales bacterium]